MSERQTPETRAARDYDENKQYMEEYQSHVIYFDKARGSFCYRQNVTGHGYSRDSGFVFKRTINDLKKEIDKTLEPVRAFGYSEFYNGVEVKEYQVVGVKNIRGHRTLISNTGAAISDTVYVYDEGVIAKLRDIARRVKEVKERYEAETKALAEERRTLLNKEAVAVNRDTVEKLIGENTQRRQEERLAEQRAAEAADRQREQFEAQARQIAPLADPTKPRVAAPAAGRARRKGA